MAGRRSILSLGFVGFIFASVLYFNYFVRGWLFLDPHSTVASDIALIYAWMGAIVLLLTGGFVAVFREQHKRIARLEEQLVALTAGRAK